MIKNKILNNCIKKIKKDCPTYNDIQLEEIKYGLEGLYLTFTKLIIILCISLLLGIFKEVIFTLLSYNIIRSTGYGLHATKSWICLVSSIICFILLPILLLKYSISIYIKYVISAITLIIFLIYAPADTKKHPMINKRKRLLFKIATVGINCIYMILLICFNKNELITNAITISLIIESVFVLPITYYIFNLQYANYKNYLTAK